jgi:hypothetical protein
MRRPVPVKDDVLQAPDAVRDRWDSFPPSFITHKEESRPIAVPPVPASVAGVGASAFVCRSCRRTIQSAS